MARKKSSKLKKAISILISFLLSFLLFVLSLMLVMQAVFFNKSALINSMNDACYIEEKTREITQELTDLGYASGLNESFFKGLVDYSLVYSDTVEYVEKFYEGTGNAINDSDFREIFNKSLDNYIIKNKINPASVDKGSREYLVSSVAKIYRSSLELPLFRTIAGYFLGVKNILPIAMSVVGVLIILLCIILFAISKWKHRACKYLCCSTITVFLATLAPAIALKVSGIIEQLNISSRATYLLFIAVGNSFIMTLIYFSVFYAVVSVLIYLLHRYYRAKKSSRSRL